MTNWRITRRKFIKWGAAATVIAGVGIGRDKIAATEDGIQCKNCGSINIDKENRLFSALFPRKITYCHNCGINLRTLTHDIKCKRYGLDCPKALRCNEANQYLPECGQIPFPNQRYVEGSKKPDFSLKMLKF